MESTLLLPPFPCAHFSSRSTDLSRIPWCLLTANKVLFFAYTLLRKVHPPPKKKHRSYLKSTRSKRNSWLLWCTQWPSISRWFWCTIWEEAVINFRNMSKETERWRYFSSMRKWNEMKEGPPHARRETKQKGSFVLYPKTCHRSQTYVARMQPLLPTATNAAITPSAEMLVCTVHVPIRTSQRRRHFLKKHT
jgi:hypothetical protein